MRTLLLLAAAAGAALWLAPRRPPGRPGSAAASEWPGSLEGPGSPNAAERLPGMQADARLFPNNAPASTPGTDMPGRIDPGLPDFARGA